MLQLKLHLFFYSEYGLYSIKTITPMEYPHNSQKQTCVCVCVCVCVCKHA